MSSNIKELARLIKGSLPFSIVGSSTNNEFSTLLSYENTDDIDENRGIGRTQLVGSVPGDYIFALQNNTANPYTMIIRDASGSSAGYPLFNVTDSTGSSSYLRVNSNTGNVGIGVDSPAYKVQIGSFDTTYNDSSKTLNTNIKGFEIDDSYSLQYNRAAAGNIASNDWYNVAKIFLNGSAGKVVVSVGGDFTNDTTIIDWVSSYEAALNTDNAGPYITIRRSEAHTQGSPRLQKARIVQDTVSSAFYVQVYLTGTGINANAFGKSILEFYPGIYAESSHDQVEAVFAQATSTYSTLALQDSIAAPLSIPTAVQIGSPSVGYTNIIYFRHDASNETIMDFNGYGTGYGAAMPGTASAQIRSGNVGETYSSENNLRFFTASNNGSNTWTQAERMRITADGNVGVGTDVNPNNTRMVIKTVETTGDGVALHLMHGDGTLATNQQVSLTFGNTVDGNTSLASIAAAYGGSNYDGDLVFKTNTGAAGNLTERMRITSAGKVFINNTSNLSTANLNIETGGSTGGLKLIAGFTPGNGNDLGSITFAGGDSANDNSVGEASIVAKAMAAHSGSTAPTDLLFSTKPASLGPGSSPIERMRITADGDVGIGVDDPTARLHVSDSDSTLLKLTRTSASNANWSFIHGDAGGNGHLWIQNADTAAYYLTLRDDGVIGVGKTTLSDWSSVFGNIIQMNTLNNGSNAIASDDVDNFRFMNNLYLEENGGGGVWKHYDTAPVAMYQMDAGRHYWYAGESKSAGSNASASEVFSIEPTFWTGGPTTKVEITGVSDVAGGGTDPVYLRITDLGQDGGGNTWNVNQDFTQLQFYSADASAPTLAGVRWSIGTAMQNTAGTQTDLIFRRWSAGVSNTGVLRLSNDGSITIGAGHLTSTPTTGQITAPYGTGTDIGGGSFNIYGGRSTGTGVGGDITFHTSPAGGSTGTSVNAHIERMRINSYGNVSVNNTATTRFVNELTSNTRYIGVASDNSDALFIAHSSGAGVGYFGYNYQNDRLIIATDNGAGSNSIQFSVNAGTTTDGGTDNLAAATAAMIIDSGGDVTIGSLRFADTPTTSQSGEFITFSTGAVTVAASNNSGNVDLFTRQAAGVAAAGTAYVSCEASGGVKWGYIIDFFFNNNTFTTTSRETGDSQGTTTCTIQENGSAISVTVTYTTGLGTEIRFNAGGHASILNY